VGGLWVVVLSLKFDQNRLSSYQDVRGQNQGFCITLANGLDIPILPYRRDMIFSRASRTLRHVSVRDKIIFFVRDRNFVTLFSKLV